MASDPTVSRTIPALAADAPRALTALGLPARRLEVGSGSWPVSTPRTTTTRRSRRWWSIWTRPW